ncbi:hypothetical protein [Sphingobium sp. CFD-2]|jgi:hypothetical protein|uniref:hypothetical protein n=1 Tax=Sphingobium sp. CFD-2 TaxID=2878542 RepID=UPI00214AB865|nr:hypothetical protein [Sphingobium sp. CFD-2]
MTEKKQPAKAERPSSKMRALFREVARDIVARDRDARKRGVTQNTIGEIERAMVKAYVYGQEALLDDRMSFRGSPDAPIDWLEIPPRARGTLSFMTICFSQRWSAALGEATAVQDRNPDEIEAFIEDGRKRWTMVRGDERSERSVGDGSVAPLIRLGLLAMRSDCINRYALTSAGVAAGKEYWHRSDAGDPTLPREGMR